MNDDQTKTKKVYQKSSNFIPLNDYYMFVDVEKPEGATNYMIWYDKVNDNDWGLTIKATPTGECYDKNYIWKASWKNHENSFLMPTKDSLALKVKPIIGELYEKLTKILGDHRDKYRLKNKF